MIGEIVDALLDGILLHTPGPTFFTRKSSRLSPLARYLAGTLSLVVWFFASSLLDRLLVPGGFDKSIWAISGFIAGLAFLGATVYWGALLIAERCEGKRGLPQAGEPQTLSETGQTIVLVSTFGGFLAVSLGGIYMQRSFPALFPAPGIWLLGVASAIGILLGVIAIVLFEAKERA